MMMRVYPMRIGGFTLIELMVSVVVLGILIGIGVPSFQSIMQRDRVTDATNDLLIALQLARSDAVRLRTKTIVCASNKDQSSCVCEPQTDEDKKCSDRENWPYGWLLLRGSDKPRTLIRVGSVLGGGVIIATTLNHVLFEQDGSASEFGHFEILYADTDDYRCIRVLPSGFISMEKMECPTD